MSRLGPPLLVLKIGGSLITDRTRFRTPKRQEIGRYASMIGQTWSRRTGKLVLVVGGGSYGHAVSIKNGMSARSPAAIDVNLCDLTTSLFELMAIFCVALKNVGVPSLPFQGSAYLSFDTIGNLNGNMQPLMTALSRGVLPVLAGDAIIAPEGVLVVSSDTVACLCAEAVQASRVVMLSNVPGVFRSPNRNGSIFERIGLCNIEDALMAAGTSDNPDITGGMRGKLEALWSLARNGIPSRVCSGIELSSVDACLESSYKNGTLIEAF